MELTLSFDSVASSLIQLLKLLEKIQGCCLSHVQPLATHEHGTFRGGAEQTVIFHR